jgi:hypothetical protein
VRAGTKNSRAPSGVDLRSIGVSTSTKSGESGWRVSSCARKSPQWSCLRHEEDCALCEQHDFVFAYSLRGRCAEDQGIDIVPSILHWPDERSFLACSLKGELSNQILGIRRYEWHVTGGVQDQELVDINLDFACRILQDGEESQFCALFQ